jgi:hypothetical protein
MDRMMICRGEGEGVRLQEAGSLAERRRNTNIFSVVCVNIGMVSCAVVPFVPPQLCQYKILISVAWHRNLKALLIFAHLFFLNSSRSILPAPNFHFRMEKSNKPFGTSSGSGSLFSGLYSTGSSTLFDSPTPNGTKSPAVNTYSRKPRSSSSGPASDQESDHESTFSSASNSKDDFTSSTDISTGSIDIKKDTPKSPSGKSKEASVKSDAHILNNDPFASEHSKALFDAIDELRMCGAGQDLALPQVSNHKFQFELKGLTKYA